MERPPAGAGWAHEIKFDGYRLQLRVESGKATLLHPQGPRLDRRSSRRSPRPAPSLPDGIIDGEVVALDHNGAPDFPALQAALSDGKTERPGLLRLRPAVRGGEDLRAAAADRAQGAAARPCSTDAPASIRYVDHFVTAGDAVLQSACRMALEGIISKRLDAPYRSGRSESWTKAKCRAGHEVVIGGWTTTTATASARCSSGVHRDGKLVHVGRVGTGFGARQGRTDPARS